MICKPSTSSFPTFGSHRLTNASAPARAFGGNPVHGSSFMALPKVARRFSSRQGQTDCLRITGIQGPDGTQRTQRGREVAEVLLGIGNSSLPARLLPSCHLKPSTAAFGAWERRPLACRFEEDAGWQPALPGTRPWRPQREVSFP